MTTTVPQAFEIPLWDTAFALQSEICDPPSAMSSYRFSTNIEVRFRDADPLGHVNNAVYFTYFEISRFHYWKKLFGEGAFAKFSFLVVRAECNFRSPAHLGETLTVRAKVCELRRSSFVFSYEIVESQTGRLIADGSTVQACFDLETKRTKSIPDEMREQIREFEGIAE